MIQYFAEDIDFQLSDSDATSEWVTSIIEDHNYNLSSLNYIFCSDSYLLTINQQYLNHDYYTDIITFNNSESKNTIEADIFISIDRVTENASKSNQLFFQELHRVMVHGVLHLLGFDDKTEAQEKEMRAKEDACLSLLQF